MAADEALSRIAEWTQPPQLNALRDAVEAGDERRTHSWLKHFDAVEPEATKVLSEAAHANRNARVLGEEMARSVDRQAEHGLALWLAERDLNRFLANADRAAEVYAADAFLVWRDDGEIDGCSVAEWLEANAESDDCAAVAKLAVGGTHAVGGGAAPEFVVRRVK